MNMLKGLWRFNCSKLKKNTFVWAFIPPPHLYVCICGTVIILICKVTKSKCTLSCITPVVLKYKINRSRDRIKFKLYYRYIIWGYRWRFSVDILIIFLCYFVPDFAQFFVYLIKYIKPHFYNEFNTWKLIRKWKNIGTLII